MNKTGIKRSFAAALALIMLATLSFSLLSCGKENESGADTAETVTLMSNEEKISESITDMIANGEIGTIQSRAILARVYENDSGRYNWLQFYNACIDGKIDFSASDAEEYVEISRATFEELEMDSQVAQADKILDVMNKVRGNED